MLRQLEVMLLLWALACGDTSDCHQALPAVDEEGNPWPTYTVAAAQLADCAQLEGYSSRQRGACSNGRRFIRKSGGFESDTLYFSGETVVGRTTWTDFVICDPWRYGDSRCNEIDVEDLSCF